MLIVTWIIYASLKKHFSDSNRPFGVLISLLLATSLSSVFAGVLTRNSWYIADIILAGGTGFWLYFHPGWPALVGVMGYQVLGWMFAIFAISVGADITPLLVPILGLLVIDIYTVTSSLAYHRSIVIPKIESNIPG